MKVFMTRREIEEGTALIAAEAGERGVLQVVGILEAARQLTIDVAAKMFVSEVHFARARSYEGVKRRAVEVLSLPSLPFRSRILLLDTIVDSGATMGAVKTALEAHGHSVVTAALIAKQHVDICALYVESAPFLLGYGLDYNGEYREMGEIVEYEDN